MTADTANDHATLPDAEAAKLYFDRFARIITHLRDVSRAPDGGRLGDLQKLQIGAIEMYLIRLANTLHALSIKHLMAGRSQDVPMTMAIDRSESGFPVFQEVATLANEARQAQEKLARMPDQATLKNEMISHILSRLTSPRHLQTMMCQRIYYELLATREMFLPQNRPQIIALATPNPGVAAFMLHWAVYDSQMSVPILYFLVVEDPARLKLDQAPDKLERVQSHLIAQSLSSLKLLTIAKGFDEDFDDLQPKFLRRIYVGPMYSHGFTEQTGPLREVLAEVSGDPASDWALSWTTETLVSSRTETQSSGFFSRTQREIFELSQTDPVAADAGVTKLERSLILPIQPFQVLVDRDPPGMRDVRKHVVAEDGSLVAGLQ